ncbi:hypothetical protein Tco_1038056 [Tanacetum coccineum]
MEVLVRCWSDGDVVVRSCAKEDTHEPLTYQEAFACEDSSKWKAAMKEEMDSLKKNKTWELVDHPVGQKLVSCKWLFKIKEGIEGVQNPSYKARIDNGKSVKMPLGGHFKLSLKDFPVRDCDVERMSKVPYANTVGSLLYLMVCTRPDIAYVAEYMALMEAVKEDIWLRGLLEELGVELNIVVVNYDNQGAIHLSQNHVFHKRTKHINVHYHFNREVLEAKTVKVLNVGTEHNVVDALTKVITILKTNMPYPLRKIRRIRACTHQRPQRKQDQYAVSREDQYVVLEIWNEFNILEDIKRVRMTKVIKEEFKKLQDVKVKDVSLTCDASLEVFNNEFDRFSGMDDNLFTYEVEIRRDDEVELTNEEFSNYEDEVFEVFRIETNIFDFETPMCKTFKEFNYLLQIDPDLLTKDIEGFKTYDEYKDDWIYEWNKDRPWVDEKP